MEWKLDVDLNEQDNLLDGITFGQVILDLYAGERVIDENAVKKVVKRILDDRLESMNFLLKNNMDEIIKKAKVRDEDDD